MTRLEAIWNPFPGSDFFNNATASCVRIWSGFAYRITRPIWIDKTSKKRNHGSVFLKPWSWIILIVVASLTQSFWMRVVQSEGNDRDEGEKVTGFHEIRIFVPCIHHGIYSYASHRSSCRPSSKSLVYLMMAIMMMMIMIREDVKYGTWTAQECK